MIAGRLPATPPFLPEAAAVGVTLACGESPSSAPEATAARLEFSLARLDLGVAGSGQLVLRNSGGGASGTVKISSGGPGRRCR